MLYDSIFYSIVFILDSSKKFQSPLNKTLGTCPFATDYRLDQKLLECLS